MLFTQVDTAHETIIIIILERENLARMKAADPVTLEPVQYGGVLQKIGHPHSVRIVIAYEDPADSVYEIARTGDGQRLFEYVMRGYKYVTDLGDGQKTLLTKEEE